MSNQVQKGSCAECGATVTDLPTTALFHEQEIHLFNPVVCRPCLEDLCREHSTPCANCGEPIAPFSQVGVLKGNRGEKLFVHMTAVCLTAGSAFHGYWGKGRLHHFVEIEAC
jgi:ribosomal protein L37E